MKSPSIKKITCQNASSHTMVERVITIANQAHDERNMEQSRANWQRYHALRHGRSEGVPKASEIGGPVTDPFEKPSWIVESPQQLD